MSVFTYLTYSQNMPKAVCYPAGEGVDPSDRGGVRVRQWVHRHHEALRKHTSIDIYSRWLVWTTNKERKKFNGNLYLEKKQNRSYSIRFRSHVKIADPLPSLKEILTLFSIDVCSLRVVVVEQPGRWEVSLTISLHTPWVPLKFLFFLGGGAREVKCVGDLVQLHLSENKIGINKI